MICNEMHGRAAGLSLLEVVVAVSLAGVLLVAVGTLFAGSARAVRSGRELTEAASLAAGIMEDLDAASFAALYSNFGGTDADTGLSADSRTNPFAAGWQVGIDAHLHDARAVVALRPLGGPNVPPTFGTALGVHVEVRIEWKEGGLRRLVRLQTLRF